MDCDAFFGTIFHGFPNFKDRRDFALKKPILGLEMQKVAHYDEALTERIERNHNSSTTNSKDRKARRSGFADIYKEFMGTIFVGILDFNYEHKGIIFREILLQKEE